MAPTFAAIAVRHSPILIARHLYSHSESRHRDYLRNADLGTLPRARHCRPARSFGVVHCWPRCSSPPARHRGRLAVHIDSTTLAPLEPIQGTLSFADTLDMDYVYHFLEEARLRRLRLFRQ